MSVKSGLGIGIRTLLPILIVLAVGVAGMLFLASLRHAPAQAVISERPTPVEVLSVMPEDVPVVISGYGEVKALDIVAIAAEVPGNVVEVNPRLEVGEVIPQGELLFKIDARDYIALQEQAQAQIAQAESAIQRLKKQSAIDAERLETLRRTRELSQSEFQRVKELFEKDQVGTRSGVDATEMAVNQTSDAYDQLAQVVELYPLRIQEAESALSAARAQHDLASTNLARTEVRAPFNARIKEKRIELGQYVRPGEAVLTLADDSVLEISVPLDSRDAREWLQFQDQANPDDRSWFGKVQPVPCRISWTEGVSNQTWEGTLDRVEKFDETTRTVTVAVRIPSESANDANAGLPLVEGMFCQVDIPGGIMRQVFRLPRWAVSFENQVYVAHDNRLQVRDVQVLRSQEEETFVSGGLKAGEQVVVTRLVNPLPNTLLAPAPAHPGESEG